MGCMGHNIQTATTITLPAALPHCVMQQEHSFGFLYVYYTHTHTLSCAVAADVGRVQRFRRGDCYHPARGLCSWLGQVERGRWHLGARYVCFKDVGVWWVERTQPAAFRFPARL